MTESPRETDFLAYRDRGDVEALARFFGAAAPHLRVLAVHAARSVDEAEDLIQSTYAEAIASADAYRGEGCPTAWMASILRYKAIDLQRRRTLEPQGADVRELVDEPALQRLAVDHLAEREFFELVVEKVHRLPSPYREVLERRLLGGLGPGAIAEELERAPGTVRMQLKRGLELLRESLPGGDALFGLTVCALLLDPRAVRAEYVPRADGVVPTAIAGKTLGASGLPFGLAWLLGAVILLLGLGLALVLGGTDDADVPVLVAGDAVADAPSVGLVAPVRRAERSTVDAPSEVAAGTADADLVAVPDLRARLVDPDGRPVSDAVVEWIELRTPLALSRLPLQPDEVPESGATTTAEDGTFAIRVSADCSRALAVQVTPIAGPEFELQVPLERAGETLDLGDLRLAPTGWITGRVRAPDGSVPNWLPRTVALRHTWTPRAELEPRAGFLGAAPVDSSGRFAFPAVPAGGARLSIGSASFQSEITATVRAGEETVLDFEVPEIGPGQRVVAHLRSRPGQSLFTPDASTGPWLWLVSSDGRRRPPTSAASDVATWDDVPEGDHELHFEARHFKPVVVTGVRRGSTHDVFVEGDSTLRLRVLDEDGQPIDELWLSVLLSSKGVTPTSSRTIAPTSIEDDGWAVFVRFPSRCTQVTAIGIEGVLTTREIVECLPGATTSVEIDLRQAHRVRGVVLTQLGAPVSGVDIEVCTSQLDESHARPSLPPLRYVGLPTRLKGANSRIVGTTDNEGRFEVRVPEDGDYDVLAFLSPWIYAETSAEPSADGVELRLPAWRSISGRLAADASDVVDGFDLEIRSRAGDAASLPSIGPAASRPDYHKTVSRLVNSDGSFGPLAVPTSPFELLAVLPLSARSFETTTNISNRPEFPIAQFEAGNDDVHDLQIALDHLAPGRIELRFTGQRPHPIEATLYGTYEFHEEEADVGGHSWSRRLERPRLVLLVTVPVDDTPVHIDGISPGTCAFKLTVFGTGASWSERFPGLHTMDPRKANRLEMEVQVAEGAILCTNAEGEALRDCPIIIGLRQGERTTKGRGRTDSLGRLSLSLPPRTLTLTRGVELEGFGVEPTGPPVEVRWGPDGPDQATVVLTEF
ncbi:RNA polymerase sigma factor SigV [Planctomycetes bacterium Pla163]|uniref:RNA polymerase sigma factor SigV n=1 Tax=Rohdeia mirabilis TaxID=2528008 RepID=A0A518D3A9_9BACT|nr:RNA polymerase sigma factor SigV [Planctomycetes bacterium Pla163]